MGRHSRTTAGRHRSNPATAGRRRRSCGEIVVTRGEVWWYEPPDSKPRPHLILTRTEVIPVLSDLLAVPATTTKRNIPTEIDLDESDGMPADCVLTTDNLTWIQSSFLTRHITTLDSNRLRKVCEAIQVATGC